MTRHKTHLRKPKPRTIAGNEPSTTTISACMIVRDEEELLPGCLESISGWVDEIIVVDTGSTDRTVEIARSFGAKIFHQPWEGDFSRHRNYSIDQATGDWILIIDADERFVIDDVPTVRKAIDSQRARIIAVNVLNVGGKYEEQVTFLPSVRLFERKLGLRYEGIVHNQLKIDPAEPVLRLGATIRHLGYGLSPEKMASKAQRTIELLDKQLVEDPDNAFALFNYAQVLLGLGISSDAARADRVLKAASRASQLTDPEIRDQRHIHLMATNQWALACFLTGDYARAEELALKALEVKPNYLDPLLLLGNVYLKTERFDDAENYFRKYLQFQATYDEAEELDDIIIMHPRSLHHAQYGLALIAEHNERWEEAEDLYGKILQRTPEFLDTNCRLGFIELRHERFNNARTHFERELEINPSAYNAAIGLAATFRHLGDDSRAEQYADLALTTTPLHSSDTVSVADSLDEIGFTTSAVTLLEKAGDGAGMPADVRRDLAALNFRLERFETAGDIYRHLLGTGETDADLYNDLAGCYFKLGVYDEAERHYELAAAHSNPSTIAWRNLGLARLQNKKPEAALDALEQYATLVPESNEVTPLMADLCFHLKQFQKAIALYERLLRSGTVDRNALYKLAECYRHLGHSESALLGYRQVLALDQNFEPARSRVNELSPPVARS